MAIELERSYEQSDQEFIRGLVGQILPKVQEAIRRKEGQVLETADENDPDILPIGGNIERQQLSGLTLIKDLNTKLETMNKSDIDLRGIDYDCLERVLGFLQRRGEDWTDEIEKIKEIRSANF